MRMAALFCRNVRRLSSVASRGSLGIVARPAMRDTVSKVSPFWSVESRADGALVQFGAASRVGALRFAGFGTFNEEHANAIVTDDNEVSMKLQLYFANKTSGQVFFGSYFMYRNF